MNQKEVVAKLLDKGILVTPENLERAEELLDDGPSLKIIEEYIEESKKRPYDHFVQHLNKKFTALENMLKVRTELQNLTSIAMLRNKPEREFVSIIGMVLSKNETRNKNFIFEIEDRTGTTKLLISKNNPTLLELAKDIVTDEVIGVKGSTGKGILFANNVYYPDIPLNKELKKGPVEEYACFVGDTHFGSQTFMEDEFLRMIKWLRGEAGNETQRNIAKKTKYVIFSGDIVEGVGVYPGQEEFLVIKDVKEQYAVAAEYLKKIPKEKIVVIIPGNHDSVRLAEPQPKFYKDYAKPIYDIPNITVLSNPSLINIGAKRNFQGFDILLYHGFSLPYYANNVPSIRAAGGQKRTDLILEYLLKRRHLSPSYGASQFVPTTDRDPLVIEKVPDFFITGHIHRLSISNYRNITIMNVGCWNHVTEDQEKRGLIPQPGKMPIVNLKTRQIHIMNFLKADKTEAGAIK